MMWLYLINFKANGPVSSEQIFDLLDKKVLSIYTFVKPASGGKWVHLENSDLQLQYKSLKLPGIIAETSNFRKNIDLRTFRNLFLLWFLSTVIALACFLIIFLLFSHVAFVVDLFSEVVGLEIYSIFPYVFLLDLAVSLALEQYLISLYWRIIQDGYGKKPAHPLYLSVFALHTNLFDGFKHLYNFSLEANKFIDRHYSNRTGFHVRKSNRVISLLNSWIKLVWAF